MISRSQILTDLRVRYREPQRHYHTLEHVAELLLLLEQLREHVAQPERLEWAIWFHDAVYDPTRRDNEQKSAELARSALTEHGLAADDVAAVAALVQATAGHQWTDGQADSALFLDLDLSILGAQPERYDAYVAQVRAEYAFVPEATFREKRGALLEGWLARPQLYFSELGRARFEQAARSNIARELTGDVASAVTT
ncbi:MAG: metal-dependent phosphohydrolase [Myxococcaceae bacterium]|nr:metal-dependent phosphohydrolase [Myxococcaceae bacterium]